ERGGRVDVFDRIAKQRVAHRPADPADLLGAERGDQRGEALAAGPVGGGEGGHRPCHASRRARLAMIAAVTPQIRWPCQSISMYSRTAPRHSAWRGTWLAGSSSNASGASNQPATSRGSGTIGKSGGTSPSTG